MPRELIEPRRATSDITSKQVNVGQSLAADRRSKAKKTVRKGEGDRGDQKGSSH